ncbi:SAM-dependent methyltransferase [Actinomadura sp. 9N407]|uniref:SAM-dependent methyltransferase n=1 Tax=Actinomadura sp. 9N407 TaxID=3375154 RepID=UPI0037A88117
MIGVGLPDDGWAMMSMDPQVGGLPPEIDSSVPHSARIWNYWLGGKDNYEIDRQVGARVAEIFPFQPKVARISRGFQGRAVRFLAGEAGVRQFLDIGSGLPTVDNTHVVAQRVAPECRIVYIDNDPMVLAHARALLSSSPEGECHYLDADLNDPGAIIDRARKLLDIERPVALMLMGITGHIASYERAREIVRTLLDALPPGSYLVHADGDDSDERAVEALRQYAATGAVAHHLRGIEQLKGFFDGLEPVEPGLVPPHRWRPDAPVQAENDDVPSVGIAGVAYKP